MKLNLWKIALIAGCLSAGRFTTYAAPLQRGDISADPAWLVHLDCDSLRPTTIGQYIQAEMEKPESKIKLALFQSLFSFDLRTQLHGITLYGTSAAPEDAVLILYADFDSEKLVNLAKAATDYKSSQHNYSVIHSWVDEKRKTEVTPKPRTYAAIHQNRVIFGQREDRLIQALSVLYGSVANLNTSNPFPELGVSDGTRFVEAAARKMKLPDSDPNAALLKLSQTIQIVLGETQRQFHGTITLVADTDEVAGHAFSIVQGLAALMKLQADKPESVKIANALTFKQNGSRVTGSLTLPAGEAVEIIRADAARKAAGKAAKEPNK